MATSRLMTLDPGNKTGIACFAAGVLTSSHKMPREFFFSRFNLLGFNEVACEEPKIYKPGKGKGDPNLLKPLIRQVGALELMCIRDGITFTMYEPRDWKGTRSKPQDHAITRRFLSQSELYIWERASEDERDAIGIGMHHLGRRKQPFGK